MNPLPKDLEKLILTFYSDNPCIDALVHYEQVLRNWLYELRDENVQCLAENSVEFLSYAANFVKAHILVNFPDVRGEDAIVIAIDDAFPELYKLLGPKIYYVDEDYISSLVVCRF